MASWLGTWAKRITLTIDKDVIDTENLTDFPVMVYLSAASGIGDVDVSCVFDELTSDANRKKIAVTSSDGTTQLYVEIEKWDDANEKAWLHVKVPTVSYNADTILYLYYDSAQSENTTYVGDTTDAVTHNVWDSNFQAVYHMAQDPNGDAADAIKDSTSNANDGTPSGSMTTADLVDGQVGKAIEFDGNDDYIQCSNESNFDFERTGSFSVCAIIKQSSVVTDNIVIGKMPNSGTYEGWELMLYHDHGGEPADTDGLTVSLINDWGGGNRIRVEAAENEIGTAQHYVSFTYNGSSLASGIKIYLDGASKSHNIVYDNLDSSILNNLNVNIGSRDGARNFGGILDEVRISNIARSAPWIKATYNSLWDSLVTFGAGEIPTSVSAEPLEGTFTLNSAGATLIDPIQRMFAEPFNGTFTLSSAGAQLLTPYYILGEALSGTFTLSGDVRLIQRTLFASEISFINSLQVGSSIDLVNSLNVKLESDLTLVMNILQNLEGSIDMKMTIEERAKVSETLYLLNRILGSGGGVSQYEYDFLKSHGL